MHQILVLWPTMVHFTKENRWMEMHQIPALWPWGSKSQSLQWPDLSGQGKRQQQTCIFSMVSTKFQDTRLLKTSLPHGKDTMLAFFHHSFSLLKNKFKKSPMEAWFLKQKALYWGGAAKEGTGFLNVILPFNSWTGRESKPDQGL